MAVQATPAFDALSAPVTASANPYDLDRLGVDAGDVVRVVGARGTFDVTVERDQRVGRGTVEIPIFTTNEAGTDVAAVLIEEGSTVTEIRLESR
jgi:anaerobic selenocysteine-containing dehydrogenase